MTEPLTVAWHAVRRGQVGKRTVAIVVGRGPIGLAVTLLPKGRGVRTVVASDYSPARRALAARCGSILDGAPMVSRVVAVGVVVGTDVKLGRQLRVVDLAVEGCSCGRNAMSRDVCAP